MNANAQSFDIKTDSVVRFRGRNRADAKRKALNFWYVNQQRLGLSLGAFSAQCRLLEDERTIVFYEEM